MNIHHVLLFCLSSALCGGNNAQTETFTGTEGLSITVICRFSFSGSRKLFCKGECTGTNILIETTDDKAHNNKYTIEYQGFFMSSGTLLVTIRQLTKSDAGRYRCLLASSVSDLNEDIELVVKDAPATSSTRSTSVSLLETTKQADTGFFLPLIICVPVIILLLAVVLLLFHKLKSIRNFDGLDTMGNTDEVEISPYDIYLPPSTCQDSVYQSLDSVSRDPDQIYSTITHT